MTTIKVSPKGEFLLPRELMEAHGFADGAEVEVTGGTKQIVLKLVEQDKPAEKKLTIEEFLAKRPVYNGPPITQEMIDQAILEEAERRWHEKSGR